MSSNVGNIKVKLNLDSAAYEHGINEACLSLKKLSAVFGALGVGIGAIQIKEFATDAIKAASDYEQAQISFGKLLKSEKDGQKLINEIQELANKTPMTSNSLEHNAKLLLNFNAVSKNDIIPTLKMLGDITGGDEAKMNSLTLAFAQSASAGRLMGQDLLQMINAGFNPLQIMAEKTGKSIAQLREDMSKGKITTDMVIQAFKDAASEGGKFYGMMEVQSQSKAGLEATKADSLQILSRTIADIAMPALKEFDKAQIEYIRNATAGVEKIRDWINANSQLVGGIQDACIAIAALGVGIPVTNAAVITIIRSIKTFGTITAATNAYQIAFATYLKGDTALALIQYRAALSATIIKVKALTVALIECPLTWVTLALGAGAYALWKYRQATQETTRAIEELNYSQDEQVRKTSDAIQTLKELQGAKNLDYNQTKRLDEAISYLTEKYPNYIGKLKEELRLKGQISKATAEQIANEMTLAKVKELSERKEKIDKNVENSIKNYRRRQVLSAARFGTTPDLDSKGRMGASKSLQRDQDKVNQELEKVKKEREAIVNELTSLEEKAASPYTYGSSSSKKKSEKSNNKAEIEAKRKQKEALDLKIALLEQEKYLTERTEDEIYQIQLKQINLRLEAAKKGSAEYAQILAEKLKLEQEHAKRVREAQLSLIISDNEAQKDDINNKITKLELYQSAYQISKRQQLQEEINLIQQKIQLEKDSLAQELKLLGNNEIEKIKIKRDSAKVQEQLNQELTRKNIELKNYEFEKFNNFTSSMTSSFSNSISSMLKGEATFAEACSSILDSMVDEFVSEVTKMTSEWINQKIRQLVFQQTVTNSTTASNAAITASNNTVAISNNKVSASGGLLNLIYTKLTGTNVAYASSTAATAGATTAAAATTTAATGAMAGGTTALITPVTKLSAAMGTLALASSASAANMAIIALSTGLFTLESLFASLTALLLSGSLTALSATSLLAAKGMSELAIANAANSAAMIPFIGWMIAPEAALATGASIAAAESLVQFREKGGPVEAGQAYIVGEKRPELFIPDRSGTILPDTSSLGGDTIHQYSISVSMPISATDAKSFESRLDEFTSRIHSNLSKQIKKRKLAPLN